MKRLAVDFAPWSRARWLATLSPWQVLACVLLLVAAGVVLWQWGERQAEWRHWADEQAAQADDLKRLAKRHAPAAVGSLPPERTAAANAVMRALQAPWSPLLDALETAAPPDVALLELTPELPQRRLHLQAEAPSVASMTRYVAWLKTRPGFSQVVLGRHELVDSDPHHPVRFEVDVRWAEVAL